jgi:uncharacterized protein YidB (DUF937 family)
MSLFEQVAGKLGGALSGTGGQESALVGGLLGMLGTGGPGGLSGLVHAFQAKGLGDIVASWVGTGANLPISAAQIQQAFGSAGIQQLAEKAGLSPEATSSKLAEILPATVDSLTPEGKVPEAGALEQALGLLRGRLG